MSTASVPLLYRNILQAAKKFPSKNRLQILEEIKAEFHANKDISGDEQAAKRKLAVDSLAQLEEYTQIDKKSPDWQVFLKGSCN